MRDLAVSDATSRRDLLVAQLADELDARLGAIRALGGGAGPEPVALAAGTVTQIITGTETERVRVTETMSSALWPTADVAPPPRWWATPLGRLVAAVRAPTTDPHAHVRNVTAAAMLGVHHTRVTQLIAEGKLEPYLDVPGAVTTRSVYERLGEWATPMVPARWDSRRSVRPWAAVARPNPIYDEPATLVDVSDPQPKVKTAKRRGTGPARPAAGLHELMGDDPAAFS